MKNLSIVLFFCAFSILWSCSSSKKESDTTETNSKPIVTEETDYTEAFQGAWNFGPESGDIKTVKEIIEISESLDFKTKLQIASTPKKKEANYLSLNIDKVKNELNWIPKWDSDFAIEQSLHWYQKFYEGEAANKLIQQNLEKYTAI